MRNAREKDLGNLQNSWNCIFETQLVGERHYVSTSQPVRLLV